MQTPQTQHLVSEHLVDRHPYLDDNFTSEIDPHEVAEAFGSRSISKYADLLICADLPDELRVKAMADILELLSCQEKKSMAIDCGLIASCSELTCSSVPDIREFAAKILAALVLDIRGRNEIDEDKKMYKISGLLFDESRAAIDGAALFFQNLSSFRDGLKLINSRSYIVEKLVSMIVEQPLGTYESQILNKVLQSLANITKSNTGSKICEQCSVVSGIVRILSDPLTENSELVLNALKTLWNLSTQDYGVLESIDRNAVESVLVILSRTLVSRNRRSEQCTEILRCCTGVLMALSTCEKSKSRIIAAGVEPLTACLFSNDQSIKHNAMKAIYSACESPGGLTKFVKPLIAEPELLIEVFETTVATEINKLLFDEVETTRLQAVVVAEMLSKNEIGVRKIVQCLKMIERLVLLLLDENYDIRSIANKALKNIVKTSSSDENRVKKLLKLHITDESILAQIIPPQ